MSWTLLQTEKAYYMEAKSIYILANTNKNFKTNKIELTKQLRKKGLDVIDINSTKSYLKQKRKGKNTVNQFRPKKWYVTLQTGQSITEDIIKTMN